MNVKRRRRALLGLAVLCFGGTAAAAQAQSRGGWELSYSSGDDLHKLQFIPAGDHHSEVYMYCEADEGWIFVSYDVERRAAIESFSAGRVSVSAPARYVEDSHFGSDAAIVATPADHPVFQEMVNGQAFRTAAGTFPVASDLDRRSIRSFVEVCDVDE